MAPHRGFCRPGNCLPACCEDTLCVVCFLIMLFGTYYLAVLIRHFVCPTELPA